MPQIDPSRAESIFTAALGHANDAARRAYVAGACGDDSRLRARVEELLAAHERAGSFMNTAARPDVASPLGSTAALPSEKPGTVIGRYKLLQEIGEGGFGVVYMAEQTEPVVRKVALKIIKLGMDTRQVIARFEAERQALAMMDHPNIAKVLDAGATPEGRPFFVMELVRGEAITEYCDRNNLSVAERLDLFSAVCNAVQHAHQKGIIHRDIKPTNVLVTMADGKPVPKVIDFGIAKATSARLTEKTLFTEFRHLIGTPAYMSPEQAEASGVDVDTRSDIYSLGVLLYELLTGTTPFDAKRLHSAAYGEIQRIIREEEPPKPSTRLSTLETLPAVAAHRHTEPAKLSRTIRGELDWIVMKCLEKDRTRRYETANALAVDIQHYLAGEAVEAAPPSAVYRLRKFVRRNKAPVAGIAAVVAALVLGVIGTSIGFVNASHQRELAKKNEQRALDEAKRAQAAEQAEKQRADELEQVAEFQTEMLGQLDPTVAGVRLAADIRRRFDEALVKTAMPEEQRLAMSSAFSNQLARVNATDAAVALIDETILKPAVKAIEQRFGDQPVVEAQLRQVVADLYDRLGLYDSALPLQKAALETRRRLLGEEHPRTLISISNMGGLLKAQGKLAEAEPYYREVLEKRGHVLGEENPQTLTSINNMGYLLQAQGKLAEAEPYFREALEKSRRVLGEEHPHTLTAINNMGGLLQAQGKLAEAEPYLREALEKKRRVVGEEHPSTLAAINNMGMLLRSQGKLAEAEPYFREALEKYRHVLGEEHPDTLTSINNMGYLLKAQGKLAEAEPYLREALEKSRRVLGEEHPQTLTAINNIGMLLPSQGKLAEAEPYLREALEKSRRVLGELHPHTLSSISNIGMLLRSQGKLAEAEPYLREALEKRRHVLGEEHPHTLASINNMGYLLQAQGKLTDAEPYLREALEKQRRVLGEEHPHTLISINNMGVLLKAQGKLAEAEPYLREALEKSRRLLGEEHPHTLDFINNMGGLLWSQDKLAEAEPYLREALEKSRRVLGEEHPSTLTSLNNMGMLLQAQGKLAEAEPYYHKAIDKARRVLGEEHPRTLDFINNMGMLLRSQGKFAEAEPLLRRAVEGRREVSDQDFQTGQAHGALGLVLMELKRFPEAERELLEAQRVFATAQGVPPGMHARCLESLVALYEQWDGAELGQGHAEKAVPWRAKLAEFKASTQPATQPETAASEAAPPPDGASQPPNNPE